MIGNCRANNAAVLAFLAVGATACLPTPRFTCDSDDDCESGATPGFCEANRVCSFADPACVETGRRHGKLDGKREQADGIDGAHAVANQCVRNFCPSDQVVAVALGPGHSCLVRASGQVWCWGRNDFGQLGDGNLFAGRSTPAPLMWDPDMGPPVVTQIAAGTRSSCGLTNQGQVFCWGGNSDGEIGQGAALTPVFARPTAVKGLPSAESLAMRSTHVCAVVSGGGVWCWGSNTLGQLGDGTTSNRRLPVPVPGIEDAQAVVVGRLHTCALRAGGTALCWGHNGSGQLGNGGLIGSPLPVAVAQLDQVVEIGAGGDHSCGRQSSGATYCWGGNKFGQLGGGTSAAIPVAQLVTGLAPDGADRLALGDAHTCVRRKDLTLWCWGDDRQGQLGQRRLIARGAPAVVAGLSDVRAAAAGAEHTCALTGAGHVKCFGAGSFGRLGQGSGEDATTPTPVPTPPEPKEAMFTNIAAGGKHTCALGPPGISCWGRNDVGQLAIGAGADRLTPTLAPALAGMRGISLGAVHGCAIRAADGAAVCWGGNGAGQVGSSASTLAAVPALIESLGAVKEIAAGGAHTCAWGATGVVSCFGANSDGQLGRPGPSAAATPQAVSLPAPAAGITAGGAHSCARLLDGRVQCWGRGQEGQLGTGFAQAGPAAPALGLARTVAVSAGGTHTCALDDAGKVRCFGANGSGQLGDGTTTAAFAPLPVLWSGKPLRTISAGGAHTCAVTEDRKLLCWGDNTRGQLGAGGALIQSLPRPVPLRCR